MTDEELIEAIADKQHAIWSHWMKYLFSVSADADDGSKVIPSEKVERWTRQMYTSYEWLSDAEQESDRHQAVKVLPELKSILRKLADAEAALAERNTPCFWTRIDGDEHGLANWNNVWESTCLRSQTTEPSDNWQFCPYCGHRIEVQP